MLYALAGGVAGYATVKLREAEREISIAQAREEVARTLHDGVLQTLAVVQRRATTPTSPGSPATRSASCASTCSAPSRAGGELGPRLRQAAARFEDHFDGRAQVVVADDLPKLSDDRGRGAGRRRVARRSTNAGKHGERRARSRSTPSPTTTAACSAR